MVRALRDQALRRMRPVPDGLIYQFRALFQI
jgi:hypothetical protein